MAAPQHRGDLQFALAQNQAIFSAVAQEPSALESVAGLLHS
jgi:hypothetical protein